MKEYRLMTGYLLAVICLLIIAVCCGGCCRRVTATDRKMILRDSVMVRDSVVLRDSVVVHMADKETVIVHDSVVVRDSVVVVKDITSGAVIAIERYRDKLSITDRNSAKDSHTDKMQSNTQTSNNSKHNSSLSSENKQTVKRDHHFRWHWWLVIGAIILALYIYNKVGRH